MFPLLDISINFLLEKFKTLEATSVAVNAILYMTCIITHKISHLGE